MLKEEMVSTATAKMMKGVAIDHFGGLETLKVKSLPVPTPGDDEILIHVESAGVGVWDPFEREGGFAKLLGNKPKFPYVLGSDGAGMVAAVGRQVDRFEQGDRVYACSLANPKGGFYAEYATAKADNAANVPDKVSTEQAGALMVDAVTALYGLDKAIGLKKGESVMIIGASGGVGHLAVQFAKRMGARVLAVASGDDGAALAKKIGADAVVDGHQDNVAAAARAFAPEGLDAALVTAGGSEVDNALSAVREGGRVAFPNGVDPEPKTPHGVEVQSYDGTPDPNIIEMVNRFIAAGPFHVHIAHTFRLGQVADAHRALDAHHLGKFILKPSMG
ncbi:MAG TPA: NADP-dependent oxidoreductase [Lacipirellulaceae bacterium]|nr:NADP-dependent oxidoreductase [Lacipirellulaceae bacterium]